MSLVGDWGPCGMRGNGRNIDNLMQVHLFMLVEVSEAVCFFDEIFVVVTWCNFLI